MTAQQQQLQTWESHDIALAIQSSKRLEGLLEKMGAEGKGLHTKTNNIENKLPSDVKKKLHYVATLRNKIVHDDDYRQLNDRFSFVHACMRISNSLRDLIPSDEYCSETSEFFDKQISSLALSDGNPQAETEMKNDPPKHGCRSRKRDTESEKNKKSGKHPNERAKRTQNWYMSKFFWPVIGVAKLACEIFIPAVLLGMVFALLAYAMDGATDSVGSTGFAIGTWVGITGAIRTALRLDKKLIWYTALCVGTAASIGTILGLGPIPAVIVGMCISSHAIRKQGGTKLAHRYLSTWWGLQDRPTSSHIFSYQTLKNAGLSRLSQIDK